MNTIGLTSFVIGLVLLLAALLGTGIKIVQVDLPKFEKRQRVIAGVAGILLVVFGLTTDGKLTVPWPSSGTTPTPSSTVITEPQNCFADLPANNIFTVTVAADRRIDQKYWYGKPRDDVIAFQWSDGKVVLGGVKLRTMTSEAGFDILTVVDGTCNPVQTYRNLDRTDVPKDKPITYDTLEYKVAGQTFVMDVAYTGDERLSIRVRQLAGGSARVRLHFPA
jgi:hypothetical protein